MPFLRGKREKHSKSHKVPPLLRLPLQVPPLLAQPLYMCGYLDSAIFKENLSTIKFFCSQVCSLQDVDLIFKCFLFSLFKKKYCMPMFVHLKCCTSCHHMSSPLDVSWGFPRTLQAHRPHWPRQKRHSPGKHDDWSNSRLILKKIKLNHFHVYVLFLWPFQISVL